MRKKYQRTSGVLHFIGKLLSYFSPLTLLPLVLVFIYWNKPTENHLTLITFIGTAALSLLLGLILQKIFTNKEIDATGSMLICALGWIFISAIGAIPYIFIIDASIIDSFFEAVSGFTTTGITVFSGLDAMPYSLLFWRALTQWIGGLGILSLFLVIAYQSGGYHHIYLAESHKISSSRPRPGLANTLKIIWGVYLLFTILATIMYFIGGMPIFDSITHAFTTLSTGGFSPHDASIAYYASHNYNYFKFIEYAVTFFMLLGGINFIIHFRLITGEIEALWDNTEIRLWWKLLGIFIFIIMFSHLLDAGIFQKILAGNHLNILQKLETTFRKVSFQVVSITTTTGFGTQSIGSSYFPAIAKQLFLVMMVIGGCVGSTGGGIKVLRVAALKKLLTREISKIRLPKHAIKDLVIDGNLIPKDEIHRISALFFGWILLLVIGGTITSFFTNLTGWESFSGMFSALGNIGPSYITVKEMISIDPIVKITYIFGMLAGRLEIIPILLLFTKKAWK